MTNQSDTKSSLKLLFSRSNCNSDADTRRGQATLLCVVILLAGIFDSTRATAGQWSASQFSVFAPALFYNQNSTALPGIPGLTFTPYPSEVGERSPFSTLASEAMENSSSVGGYSILQISFNPPVQAVGGYPFPLDTFENTITETVYDQNSNVLDSASITVYEGASPVFLGLGETTTNIYRVRWTYSTAEFFGVANIIYQPAPPMVLSNPVRSSTSLSFQFQSQAGHTNLIQTCTNLATGSWTTLTNLTLFGDETVKKITVPTTNAPAALYRVQAF